MMQRSMLVLVAFALGCDALMLPSAAMRPALAVSSSAAIAPVRTAEASMIFGGAKAAKKPLKKAKKVVAKKPIKKAKKVVAKKAPVKKGARNGRKLAEGQVGLLGGRPLREEIPFFLNQAGTAVNDYGGGNGL